jgi:Dyp-type peroxidase family
MFDEPVLRTNEIQADIIPGFKNDHQHFVFFRIDNLATARTWLSSLSSRIHTAAEVQPVNLRFTALRLSLLRDPEDFGVLWMNVAISASGLRKLVGPAEVEQFEDVAFKVGLTQRSALLGDPPNSDEWKIGGSNNPVDFVLILAANDAGRLDEAAEQLRAEAEKAGCIFAGLEKGSVREGANAGHEHFGFKDGISMPAVRGLKSEAPGDYFFPRTIPAGAEFDNYRLDFAAPGQPLVWPGHFLFGYGRQAYQDPRSYNPKSQPQGPAWATDGSFLVFRRLSQDVAGFQAMIQTLWEYLSPRYPQSDFNPDRLGALLVGRWKSGTPIIRSPLQDIGITGSADNHFSYADSPPASLPDDPFPLNAPDSNGLACPLAAHIRKVNPRDQATDLGVAANTLPKSILRRGIPFGTSDDPKDPASANLDRGLLFVCFQSSITDQFEFLMQRWVNNRNKPLDAAGEDPILGITGKARSFVFRIDPDKTQEVSTLAGFVKPTGGEYFFCPSISFFRDYLA